MKPVAQLPAVYMPGVPAASVERGGAEPTAPASGRTLASPRQMGGEGVAERVAGGLRLRELLPVPKLVGDTLGVSERDVEPLPVPVPDVDSLSELVWLGVELRLAVALDEGAPDWLDVELRLAVALNEGVPDWLDEPVAVALDEPEPVALDEPEPIVFDEPEPVALDEPLWLRAGRDGAIDVGAATPVGRGEPNRRMASPRWTGSGASSHSTECSTQLAAAMLGMSSVTLS